MKIFTAQQQKDLDKTTILQEPISSFDLMKRASAAFCNSFLEKVNRDSSLVVFCGKGNNGGDGLCIATILHQSGYDTFVVLMDTEKGSPEYNLALEELSQILPASRISFWPSLPEKTDIAIDAIFGIGLNKKVEGKYAKVIHYVNDNYKTVYAVDIPSGLFADKANEPENAVIKSSACFTFNAPKLSFFLPENGNYIPKWEVIDIGITQKSKENLQTTYSVNESSLDKLSILARPKFSHKGTFGHGLLWAGSHGMYGAANLAAKASLRSGLGKLTVISDKKGFLPIQINSPEAMFLNENNSIFPESINAVAIGPGLGRKENFLQIFNLLRKQFENIPWVIDADGLNQMAKITNWESLLPSNTILTPHPKEFDRLTRMEYPDHLSRIEAARAFSKSTGITIVLKGAHTAVCSPTGKVTFNTSGNESLATAGSGDVLTGILLGFLCQSVTTQKAANQAVFLHGKLGEFATRNRNSYAVMASDLIENLGKV